MANTITVQVSTAHGGLGRLTFTKAEGSQGRIEVATWAPGKATAGSPDSDLNAEVYDIETSPDLSRLRCKTDHRLLLFPVTITIDVQLLGSPPSLSLSLQPDLLQSGVTTYGITTADETALRAFLRTAGFGLLQVGP